MADRIVAAVTDVRAESVCECSALHRDHEYWEDRIYDVNGYRCPKSATGSDFRFSSTNTNRHLRLRQVAAVRYILESQALVAGRQDKSQLRAEWDRLIARVASCYPNDERTTALVPCQQRNEHLMSISKEKDGPRNCASLGHLFGHERKCMFCGEPQPEWTENPPHGPVSERFMRHHYGARLALNRSDDEWLRDVWRAVGGGSELNGPLLRFADAVYRNKGLPRAARESWADTSLVRESVRWLLTDAREADAASGHEQRENWRLSHIDLVARWFGVAGLPSVGEAGSASAIPTDSERKAESSNTSNLGRETSQEPRQPEKA